jgi:hypothetical protein
VRRRPKFLVARAALVRRTQAAGWPDAVPRAIVSRGITAVVVPEGRCVAGVTCPECRCQFAERAKHPSTHLIECPQCRARFPRPVEPGAGPVLAVVGTILGLLLVVGGAAGWVVYRQYHRAQALDAANHPNERLEEDARPARQP